MRKLVLIILSVVLVAFMLAAYALAARFVLQGPVTASSLHEAVERQSDSAGNILETRDRCRRLRAARTWRCSVYDSSGSGGVDYRVRVRTDSSCFDGRLTANYGEGGLPRRISGCVYRWQWNVFDLL